MSSTYDNLTSLREKIREESAFVEKLHEQVGRVIVGQKDMVERILVGLLCRGHILLEGVPGLAKTLTIHTVAQAVDAAFKRIQFTPDLLPADLVGTMIYRPESASFSVKKGPVFTNIVLADEINRAPAKVQSALLEAMQERQVTIGDETHALPDPFIVLATQNPIEQEGTYPLPEAQVDRFLLKLKIDYPARDEEKEIMRRQTAAPAGKIEAVLHPAQLAGAQSLVREIFMDEKLEDYILDIIFATRFPEKYGLKDLKPLIAYGASPRATIALALAARAHAFLRHEGWVRPDNIKAVAHDVLRHRVILTFEAEAEEIDTDEIIQRMLDRIEVP